jgi:WhiB family transcriptional regulator, redox-sensing transcriptional regulator
VVSCLPDLPRNLTWQLKAACLGLHGKPGEKDLFFSPDNPGGPKEGKGIGGERDRIMKAKTICSRCPVIRECLQYALVTQEIGIWGGTTDGERRKLDEKAA